MKIRVMNDLDKKKEIKIGFSWTTFFFGFFVPLFRGDWKWFAIYLVGAVLLGAVSMGILSGVLAIVFPFFYNRLYATDLYNKGYRGLTEEENKELKKYITD